MKTRRQIFSVSLCWLMCSTLVIAQDDKEKTAIKTIIEKETRAYLATDNKAWNDCWVHAPYAFWSSADSTGYNNYSGWKAIEIGFGDYFLTTKPRNAKLENRYNDIRVYGNGAYARFVQVVTEDGVVKEEDEIRILEKQNGQWKLVLVGVMQQKQKNKLNP